MNIENSSGYPQYAGLPIPSGDTPTPATPSPVDEHQPSDTTYSIPSGLDTCAVGGAWEYFTNAYNGVAVQVEPYIKQANNLLNDTLTQVSEGLNTSVNYTYGGINQFHDYVSKGLDMASEYADAGLAKAAVVAAPATPYWQSVKDTVAPITEQTPAVVTQAFEYIGNNPLNTAGAAMGVYLAGKGIRNLFNANASKTAAFRHAAAGLIMTAGSLLPREDTAWKLMELTLLSTISLAVLWERAHPKTSVATPSQSAGTPNTKNQPSEPAPMPTITKA